MQFRESLQRIASPSHYRITVLLASIHLLLGFVYMGVTTFSSAKIKELNDHQYQLHKKHILNANYTSVTFYSTIENIQYKDSLFKNVTFYHMEFNHVEFLGCTFDETEFTNVKSSITYFENSTVKDSRLLQYFPCKPILNCLFFQIRRY